MSNHQVAHATLVRPRSCLPCLSGKAQDVEEPVNITLCDDSSVRQALEVCATGCFPLVWP